MIIEALSFLTLAADITIVLLLASLALRRSAHMKKLWQFISRNGLALAFIVAATATLGSLYFSEIAGLVPCKLCWFQRIFMYPLSIITGIAWLRKDRKVFMYVLPMAIIGACISAYHYAVQRLSVTCSVDGGCSSAFFYHYGYISIPVMAFSAFLLIIIFCLSLRNRQ